MTASRLVILVGILLLAGVAWSLRAPTPGLFPDNTLPVQEGELWRLNER